MTSPPSCTEQDFKLPHLRRCTFDFSTIVWELKLGGGLDGYVWKVWLGETGPFALNVNASIFQMIETAIAQAAIDSKPIRVLANPKTKQEARYNLFWFSDEARLASFPEDLEAAEITSMPRFRKCYGWLKFSGEIQRSISWSKEYTAIVYEYVEEGENEEAVVEEVDRFCWLTGFSHNLSPAARNWKSRVLVDLADIIHARGYGWHEVTYKQWTADLILVE
ncbi:hypothetical protein MRS44_010121 [Fusarium solani]|uniref:uncharacterized protein n=1 Tax=Fusarium solani TaxID=169388 RepID=UPI0032C4255F|nr:hypothetical protein MRS44_010121 [Fusarium solani]